MGDRDLKYSTVPSAYPIVQTRIGTCQLSVEADSFKAESVYTRQRTSPNRSTVQYISLTIFLTVPTYDITKPAVQPPNDIYGARHHKTAVQPPNDI